MLQEQSAHTPNLDAIRADLAFMTRRWHELSAPAWIEIRAFDEYGQPQIGHFKPDWIEGPGGAVEWTADMNKRGRNCYAVRNPVRDEVGKAASDTDILAAFYLWADCDEGHAAENVLRFPGPKWVAAITTGKVPSTRVHTYWELTQPCTDLAAWRDMQSAIARHFGSDPSVINPSRIMRIGGTISWPSTKKVAKGYIPELTTIRTEYPETREPVTLDQMQRAFAASTPATLPLSVQAAPAFQIDTGSTPQSLDRERLAIQAMQGQEWHNAVIRLVASYVAKGLSDTEIHALTQPLTLAGYTGEQTSREVQTAIDGARRKGWTPDAPDTQFRELTEAEVEAIPPLMFQPWQSKDLSAIPVPEFLYSDFYARKYTSVTLAAPKVGKSMLALAEALDMATGRGFLTGLQRDPLVVVYYNAEDDQDMIDARVAALLTHYGIPQTEIEGRFYPVSGVMADDFYMMSGDVPVINEPLFVGLEKFCEASAADVLIFDPLQDLSRSGETNEAFRLLGQRLRRMANKVGVALGLIHHTRKVAPGMTPSIDDMRGGGALRGTARFNRILISMTEEEAAKAGVPNHRHFMRIGDMESNLAPPSSEVNQWYQKISVLTPNGHHVGAIEKWEWPDAFDGLSKIDAARVQSAILAMSEPPLESIRSPNRWAGIVVAEVLGLDISDKGQKARVASLIKGWVASGVLAVETAQNARAGREVNVIVAGPNNPLSEASA